MPELLGCFFEVKDAEFIEFIDNSEKMRGSGIVDSVVTCQADWDTHASTKNAELRFSLEISIGPARKRMIKLLLKMNFNVLGATTMPETADMMGLPGGVWFAMGQIGWAHIIVKLKTQPTPVSNATIPPPTYEQLVPTNSFGGFSLN